MLAGAVDSSPRAVSWRHLVAAMGILLPGIVATCTLLAGKPDGGGPDAGRSGGGAAGTPGPSTKRTMVARRSDGNSATLECGLSVTVVPQDGACDGGTLGLRAEATRPGDDEFTEAWESGAVVVFRGLRCETRWILTAAGEGCATRRARLDTSALVEHVDLPLYPAGLLEIHVHDRATGEPIEGASVHQRRSGQTTRTDAAGFATFPPWNPGEDSIRVTAQGYAPGIVVRSSTGVGTGVRP